MTRGFRREISRWYHGVDDATPERPVAPVSYPVPVELWELPDVRPDAFLIHRYSPRCDDHTLFLIDAIEVDGSSVMRQKIDRWADFGTALDWHMNGLLRLRIFSEHFVQIGEYDEMALREIDDELFIKALQARQVSFG
jgi:hypothetical protein